MYYLLFDADMTFWDFHTTEQRSLVAMANHLGVEHNEQFLADYDVGNKWCWKQFEDSLLTIEKLEEKRWELFFERTGMLDQNTKEAAEFFGNQLASNGILLPGAGEFLENIKDLPKSLVTNGIARIQRARLKSTDTEKYFEHIFISQELGVNKPQKAFFDIVLATLGKDKDECIVIGDSENSDIRGANNAGIKSIYLNFKGKKSENATWSVSSYEELEALLRSL